jgi:Rrf2 family protein
VNLELSHRGRYVVRAAVFLAAAYGSGRVRTRQEVSEAMAVPRAFVPQVLSDLVRSGLVVSVSGARGGYRLARPPEQVRLSEVVEAGEGPRAFGGCGSPSASGVAYPLQELWTEASTQFRRALSFTSLAQLVDPGAGDPRRTASLPCGVLAARRPSADLRAPAGGVGAEQVGEELVERDRDRVRTTSRPRSRRGGDGEEDAENEDDEQ